MFLLRQEHFIYGLHVLFQRLLWRLLLSTMLCQCCRYCWRGDWFPGFCRNNHHNQLLMLCMLPVYQTKFCRYRVPNQSQSSNDNYSCPATRLCPTTGLWPTVCDTERWLPFRADTVSSRKYCLNSSRCENRISNWSCHVSSSAGTTSIYDIIFTIQN